MSSTFTRKHYQIIAAALNRARPNPASGLYLERNSVWWDVIREIQAKFSADNPRFDGRRFVEACLADPPE